jgi:hypothetical protein
MSETEHPPVTTNEVATNGPEPVHPDEVTSGGPEPDAEESVTSPAKVMRIGSMVKQLLEEVRTAPLDEASRERLAEIYERSVTELSEALSPDLQEELRSLALPFDEGEVPSEAELRIAKAQLVGWLEGLFHGIQATLMAQQFAAQRQLQEMRQLPGGPTPPGAGPQESGPERPGTYL